MNASRCKKSLFFLLVAVMSFVSFACGETTVGDEIDDNSGDFDGEPSGVADGDSDVEQSDIATSDEADQSGAENQWPYAPLLSDPGQVDLIFGDEEQSSNMDFGQTFNGVFVNDHIYAAHTFDALPGARVTLRLISSAASERLLMAVYGPRGANGLWGEARAMETIDSDGRITILNYPVPKYGTYLVLVIRADADVPADYRLSLGCHDRCTEPACPDLTCQSYCENGRFKDANGCFTCECRPSDALCESSVDCPAEHVCENGTCVSENDKNSNGGTDECGCETLYDPVCGDDGRTYANACVAECSDVEIMYTGECVDVVSPGQECTMDSDCPEDRVCIEGICQETWDCNCPDYVDPVCGTDGKTYTNRCELECFGAEYLHDGSCNTGPEGDCIPYCDEDGSNWITCSGVASDASDCGSCEPICRRIDTKSEGWYSSCDDSLIEYADCGSGCGCNAIWEPVCGSDNRTYANICEAKCAGVAVLFAGSCGEMNSGCSTDSDCPDGWSCSTDPECDPTSTDAACPSICVSENDDLLCSADIDCPDGFWCVADSYSADGFANGTCEPIDEDGCVATGCHLELCLRAVSASDCSDWKPAYACLVHAQCRRLETGQCGWDTSSTDYAACMQPVSTGQSCAASTDCPKDHYCENGGCMPSECLCDPVEDPVCGTDGTTYDNPCLAACAGVNLIASGTCE